MARLLKEPIPYKASKAELAGAARMKLRLKGMLNTKDAGGYLMLHPYTVREFIQNGFIDTLLIGARHYLEEDELLRLKGLLDTYGSLARAKKAADKQQEFPDA